MIRRRLFALAAATVALATTLTACGGAATETELAGSWDEIVAAAKDEGSVTLYSTHAPDNLELLKKAFEAKYGIKLNYVRGTDADIVPKVETEIQTGQGTADVQMATDAGFMDRATKEDWNVEVVGPSFDNADYKRSESIKDGKWFLSSATVFGYGWNTSKLPKGLHTYEDVLAADTKGGKLGITNPAGIPTYVDMYRRIDADWGGGFVEKLAAQKPRIYPSAVAIDQAIASGEIWGSPTVGTTMLDTKASGAPVDFVVPKDPFGVPWYSQVLASAPHANAAQVLADFMVTPEGQAAISHNYVAALPGIDGTGVPGSDLLAQDIELPDPKTLDQDSVNEYQKQWESLFQS
ncbi:ABC transporter substrate-binding protein [Nocardioides luteus]|uniref:ABC transporter substrate-binding protein n=1 Tax=Nocardioides luteus TaxID=1844 RepID=UPI0018C99300|nr:extracellular solute-binding protein [Nocardioides luteus]MBG6096245.1 iron(III) transport system substrate-binding protein [Nocardioides luteus]